MKKIIDGRRYDTEAAKEVARARSSVGRRDFHWWEETLYQKRTGEFFLYGEGGPASRYSQAIGLHEWTSGDRIMPLSIEEAKKWAEENLDGDEYEAIFGVVEELDERKVATFSLASSTINKIAELAVSWGCSKSEVIDRLIQQKGEQ